MRTDLPRIVLAVFLAAASCRPGRSTESGPSPSPGALDPLAEAQFRRAEMKFGQGLTAEALAEIDEVLRIAPDHGPAHLLRGRAHFLRAEYLAAIVALERCRELQGESDDLLYLLAESHLQRQDHDAAEREYRRLLERNPAHKDGVKRLALLYASTDQIEKAKPALLRARELNPDDADVLVQLGIVLRNQNDFPGSRAALERAREVAPTNSRAWYELGLTLRHDEDLSLAREAFEATVRIDATHDGALYQLVQLARQRGDADQDELMKRYQAAHAVAERERELRNALEYSPSQPELIFELGLLEARHGRVAEAETIFARALLLQPDHRPAATNLGRARMQLGRAREAIPAFERAVALAPDVPFLHIELAEALLEAGVREEAVREIGRAGELWSIPGERLSFPAHPTLVPGQEMLLVGSLYERAGLLADAERSFDEAVRRAPQLGDARAARGLLRARAGRGAEARADLEEAIRLRTRRETEVRETLAGLGS